MLWVHAWGRREDFWVGTPLAVACSTWSLAVAPFALEKGVLYVHLVEVPHLGRCERDHGSDGSHLCYWGKGLFVVDTMCLRIALCYKLSLIPIEGVVGVVLHFEYPPTSNCLLWCEEGKISHVSFLGSACISSFIASTHRGFGKGFQFSYCCHFLMCSDHRDLWKIDWSIQLEKQKNNREWTMHSILRGNPKTGKNPRATDLHYTIEVQ